MFQAKVQVAEQTEVDIDKTRSQYIPVAVNTQILFFCVADMASIDPMYQYSLEWFINIFLAGIANAERAGKSSKPGWSLSSIQWVLTGSYDIYSCLKLLVYIYKI